MTPERFQSPPPKPVEREQKEQTLFEKIDATLRDKETAFAKLLEAISPEKGEEYLNSNVKRHLDRLIAVPAAVISTPIIVVLRIAKKLEDGGTAFFVQERYRNIPNDASSKSDMLKVWKIRTMYEGAEKDVSKVLKRGVEEKLDPRQTKFGKTLRKYKLDELPQLFQVITGQLSAIGARPLPRSSIDMWSGLSEGKEPSPLFNDWASAYNKGKKGLTGLHQVRESGMRVSGERFHYDFFIQRTRAWDSTFIFCGRRWGVSSEHILAERAGHKK